MASALAVADDPLLDGACVVEVRPAPDASRLCVVASSGAGDLDLVRARLEGAAGLLRGEVARTLQRKRTPELAFVVIPAWAGGEP